MDSPLVKRKYVDPDEELATLIDHEIANSIGGSGGNETSDSENLKNFEEAWKYYFGKARGDEVEGRSKVISMDVGDVLEQSVAQIMPAFETKQLGAFTAYAVNDQKQADLESRAVNWSIFTANKGKIELQAAIRNILLLRNGYIHLFVDEYFEVVEETLSNLSTMALGEIAQQDSVEITGIEQTKGEVYDQNGFLAEEGIYEADIKRTIQVKKLCMETVSNDDICINSDHSSVSLTDARFVCITRYLTRSELVQRGIDEEIVVKLESSTTKTSTTKTVSARSSRENDMNSVQFQQDRIELKECYYQVDYDHDGITERRRILKAGDEILENEAFPVVPIASGTAIMVPNKHQGMSLYDKLKQVQDSKTSFLRKTLDNAEGLINQRTIAVPGAVNMDDLVSSRPTGVVRAKRTDAIAPFPVQNMGDTGFKMLNYLDKTRKEAAGAQLDIGTQENIPVQGQTAHGMERWMSSQEQLSKLMIDTISESLVTDMFLIAHLIIRIFMPERMQFTQGQNLVATDPATWPPRPLVSINIQKSMAERQRLYQVLDGILEKQLKAKELGKEGILVSDANMYNLLCDQAKLAGLEEPTRYWIDPMSQQAMAAAQNAAKMQQMAEAKQDAQQKQLIDAQIIITQMQEQSDHMKAQLDYLIKTNEQLRKWTELEQQYQVDIKGEGAGDKKTNA